MSEVKIDKNSPEYGKPKAGTLSAQRGQAASKSVAREMLQLCEIILQFGKKCPKTESIIITFGELFNIYTYISDKVVGMLLRCRKNKMVDFEGEMLFQKRDDHVVIKLLLSPQDLKQQVKECEQKMQE